MFFFSFSLSSLSLLQKSSKTQKKKAYRQLPHGDPVGRQPLGEVGHLLGDQRLHRGHVDDLEGRGVDGDGRSGRSRRFPLFAVAALFLVLLLLFLFLSVQPDDLEHRQHGHVGLPGARGSAHQQVSRPVESGVAHARLDPVERLHAGEGRARPRRQGVDGHELLAGGKGGGRGGRDVDLLVALEGGAVGALGEVAALVGHGVGSGGEGEGVEVDLVAAGGRGGGGGCCCCCGSGSAGVVGGGAFPSFTSVDRARLLPDLPLRRRLPVLGRQPARRGQLGQHLCATCARRGRGGLDRRALFRRPRARERDAPDDLRAVAQQRPDEVELVEVEQGDERVLGLAVGQGRVGEQGVGAVGELLGRRGVERAGKRGRDAALEPVGVDVVGRDAARGRVVCCSHFSSAASDAASDADGGTRPAIVVVVSLDLDDFVGFAAAQAAAAVLVLRRLALELDSDANLVVEASVAVVVIRSSSSEGRVAAQHAPALCRSSVAVEEIGRDKVGHEPAERDDLRVPLGAERTHQGLDLALLLRLRPGLVLEHCQHLLGGAVEDVGGLVAELGADNGQKRGKGVGGRAGAGHVAPRRGVCGVQEAAAAANSSSPGLAPGDGQVVVDAVSGGPFPAALLLPPRGLVVAAAAGAGPLGLGERDAVAHLRQPPGQGLGRARGLGAGPAALLRGEHEVGVLFCLFSLLRKEEEGKTEEVRKEGT